MPVFSPPPPSRSFRGKYGGGLLKPVQFSLIRTVRVPSVGTLWYCWVRARASTSRLKYDVFLYFSVKTLFLPSFYRKNKAQASFDKKSITTLAYLCFASSFPNALFLLSSVEECELRFQIYYFGHMLPP